MKNKQRGFSLVLILAIVGVLGLIGASGWYVYNSKQKPKSASNASSSKSKKAAAKTPVKTAEVAPISESLKENIAASIETGNTAALEGYMADSVTVVLAATEKGGAETAAEAVTDLNYVSAGTSPWNFTLPAATLDTYKAGSYGQYFGDRTVVGKSANDYVISFHVNDAGKIDAVFMSVNADLLI